MAQKVNTTQSELLLSRIQSSLINLSQDLICVIDQDGSLKYFNPAWEEVLGYSKAEMESIDLMDLIHPEDVEKTVNEIRNLTTCHITKDFQNRYIHKNGSPVHLDWRARFVAETGESFCIGRNIPDSVLLDRKEEEFRAVYHNSPIAIELFDEKGRLRSVNQACLDLFGVTAQSEVMGFSLFEDPNMPTKQKVRLLKGQKIHYQVQFSFDRVKELGLYKTRNKGTLWLEVIVAPTNFPIKGYIAQVVDINEIVLGDDALVEKKSKLALLYKMTQHAISLHHPINKKIMDVNPAWCELFGIQAQDAVGKTMLELGLCKNSKKINDLMERVAKEGSLSQVEVDFLNLPDTESSLVLVDLEEFDEEAFHLVAVTYQDITDRKETERKLDDVNVALTVLLDKREGEKKEREEKLHNDVSNSILPYLDQLRRSRSKSKTRVLCDTIEHNLKKILLASDGSDGVQEQKEIPLTQTEFRVADMIRAGKTSKEIATALNVSVNAVQVHRYHIRKKLGLLGKKINLYRYLSTNM